MFFPEDLHINTSEDKIVICGKIVIKETACGCFQSKYMLIVKKNKTIIKTSTKRKSFLSFLQTFRWDSAPSISWMRYHSKLWNDLASFFENDFTLFDLTSLAAFSGFLNNDSKLLLLQNHLLFVFKIIYNSRRSETLILKYLIREIMKVKNRLKKKFQ